MPPVYTRTKLQTICPAFKAALPSDLRSNLKTVTKYTDNVGNASGSVAANVTATTDDIFARRVVRAVGKAYVRPAGDRRFRKLEVNTVRALIARVMVKPDNKGVSRLVRERPPSPGRPPTQKR